MVSVVGGLARQDPSQSRLFKGTQSGRKRSALSPRKPADVSDAKRFERCIVLVKCSVVAEISP